MRALTVTLLLALTTALSPPALAQNQAAKPATAPASDKLKAEQLDQLVAPIALYPDPLLAEVMMASTYPLEVVEADRWAKANKQLKGDQQKAALEKQKWDDSVKSLVATPTVLDNMSSKLEWTKNLGDAVLAQQADVMDAVQRLRAKAQAQNNLKTTKEQKVSTKTEQNKQVIVIEPANPATVYVPYYQPTVYGAWAYPSYPPYYWAPPVGYGYLAGAAIGFGVGWAVGAAWGGSYGWGSGDINIDRNTNINIDRDNKFNHKPEHRQGVRYNNSDVAKKFDRGGDRKSSADMRKDFRGHKPDQGALGGRDGARPDTREANRGSDRGGNRADSGNRGGGDKRAGNTQSRPSGGNKAAPKGRDNAFSGVQPGGQARAQADRGRSSVGSHDFGGRSAGGRGGGGGRSISGGGGRGGGGGGRGGGGRRR
jgi:hypothetical protein